MLYKKDKREVGSELNYQGSLHEGLGPEGGRQKEHMVVALFICFQIIILIKFSIKIFFHL